MLFCAFLNYGAFLFNLAVALSPQGSSLNMLAAGFSLGIGAFATIDALN